MKLNFLLTALCIAGALGDKEEASKVDKKVTQPKPKREALIGGGNGYHGPSYKYLPPTYSSHTRGFDSYGSGHHLVSDDLAGYGIGSSAQSGAHGHGGGHFVSSGPKVETYIVQTETAQRNYGSSIGGSVSHSGIGYKYGGASASFSGGHSGLQSNVAGSFSHGHGPLHKIKAIVIPAQSFSTSGHGNGGYSRFGDHSGGFSYSKALTGDSHYSNHVDGEYATHGSISGGGFNSGYLSGSDFSRVQGSYGFEKGIDYSSLESSYRGSDHSSGQAGYSHDAPNPTYTYGNGHSILSSNYAAPNIITPSYHAASVVQQTPAYATGHKGLGHFGFSPSKPQALNTNFIDSSRYGESYVIQGLDNYDAAHGVSRAPFKPSLFLGALHEESPSGAVISTEHGPPAGGPGISSQYVPPSKPGGYDYPSPSALYGAATDTYSQGDGSDSVHEPENTYLPPSAPHNSYGPPAPRDSYLPPHH